jgi:ATP-dependent DNA ligase
MHRSSDAPVLNLPLNECIDNTHRHQFIRERNRKETNKELKQVIKSQTKAKTRALERANLSPLRQGNDSTQLRQNCSKMPTPQGEAKGLDTIGKRAKHKANSATRRAPKA